MHEGSDCLNCRQVRSEALKEWNATGVGSLWPAKIVHFDNLIPPKTPDPCRLFPLPGVPGRGNNLFRSRERRLFVRGASLLRETSQRRLLHTDIVAIPHADRDRVVARVEVNLLVLC